MNFINIIQVLGGLAVLLVGGEILVKGASNIAYSFKISSLVVGLTIVAFGTSAPELLISSYSALTGSPDISMGNVVGSNICNLALVLPITALIFPIAVAKDSIQIDWTLTIGSSILLLLMVSWDNQLSWYEGVILFLTIIAYTVFLIRKSRKESKDSDEEITEEYDKRVWFNILLIAGGAIALFAGSKFFVDGAKSIAKAFGVTDLIIGLTVVALGTSLPELVTSAIAAKKKDTDLAMGNLLGSCIFNVLSILGITSILTPFSGKDASGVELPKFISVNQSLLNFPSGDFWWMLLVMVALLPLMLIRKKIGRFEGLVLLGIYVAYIIVTIQSASA